VKPAPATFAAMTNGATKTAVRSCSSIFSTPGIHLHGGTESFQIVPLFEPIGLDFLHKLRHGPQELQLPHKPPRHEKNADTDPDGEQRSASKAAHNCPPNSPTGRQRSYSRREGREAPRRGPPSSRGGSVETWSERGRPTHGSTRGAPSSRNSDAGSTLVTSKWSRALVQATKLVFQGYRRAAGFLD
jgi:hypothetical protein